MRPLQKFLHRWHAMLGLVRQSPASWHEDRLREEIQERDAAITLVERLSESSDVIFTISRAQYDGFPVGDLPPLATLNNAPVYAFMLGKFTMRWAFYRTAAYLCGAPHWRSICEVVNPAKDSKLEQVALRHDIDPVVFVRVGSKLRPFFPLLP
ncbi:hypothetical protein BFW01_g7498 [Lasiodiplodia theobromae]|nr:hypothetical protein BFW01_g7498 [Lasiodiplodia theobromae]